jgi:hypothetical protein
VLWNWIPFDKETKISVQFGHLPSTFCTYDGIGSEKILRGTTMVKGRDEIEMHLL